MNLDEEENRFYFKNSSIYVGSGDNGILTYKGANGYIDLKTGMVVATSKINNRINTLVTSISMCAVEESDREY